MGENYEILNLHHVEFESATYEKQEAIPLEQLLGILGGNLGLFMGFSVMTFIELIEGLVFFLLAVPWLFLRMNLFPYFSAKRRCKTSWYVAQCVTLLILSFVSCLMVPKPHPCPRLSLSCISFFLTSRKSLSCLNRIYTMRTCSTS